MHQEVLGTEPIYAQQQVHRTNVMLLLIFEWEFTIAFRSFNLQAEIWNQLHL
jgi:hypothetical protein